MKDNTTPNPLDFGGFSEEEFAMTAKHLIRSTTIHVQNLYSSNDATNQLWTRAIMESALMPQDVYALTDIVERTARERHISENGLIELCKRARTDGMHADQIRQHIAVRATSQARVTRDLFYGLRNIFAAKY